MDLAYNNSKNIHSAYKDETTFTRQKSKGKSRQKKYELKNIKYIVQPTGAVVLSYLIKCNRIFTLYSLKILYSIKVFIFLHYIA